jgi:hypothetical protein
MMVILSIISSCNGQNSSTNPKSNHLSLICQPPINANANANADVDLDVDMDVDSGYRDVSVGNETASDHAAFALLLKELAQSTRADLALF